MIQIKRLFCLVLCLAMLLSLAPASVFAEMAGEDSSTENVDSVYTYPEENSSWIESTGHYSYMDLEVIASSTDVGVGDTITYTVYAYGYDILAMDFQVYIPEGLSYVPGSGQIPGAAQENTGWETMTWSEDTMSWSGSNEWATQFGEPVLTFSCVAEAKGEYVVRLTDAIAYDSMNMDLFAYVYEDTVEVSGAKKTVYFDATGTGWSDVYCVTWNESGILDDVKMIPESNFWKVGVPYGTTGFIVSDGNGMQTHDITISGNQDAWIAVGDDYSSFEVSYEAPVPMPEAANSGEGAVAQSTASYYVAGHGDLCGSNWVADDSNNIMTLGQDGLYTKVYENVAAGSYQLKVTDGTWGNNWGVDGAQGNNYVVTVEATSTVTVIFNPETGTIDTDVVPNESEPDLPEEPEYITVYVSIDSETVPMAWAWGDYGDAFDEWPGKAMTSMKGDVYSCRVSVDATYITFNNGVEGEDNQTAELTIPTDDKNLYTYSTDTWSVYDPNAWDFYVVMGTEGLCGSDWHPADVNNLMALDPDTGIYTKTYENVPAGNYELKVAKNGLIENNYNHQGVVDGDSVSLTIMEGNANLIVTFDGEKVQVTVVGDGCVHSFVDYVSNNDATCEDGTKTATCEHCDATHTVPDVGSALGHVFEGEWQVVIPNSCTTDGLQCRRCSRCGGMGATVLTTDLPSCTGDAYVDNMNKYFPAIAVEGAVKYEITLSANSALESDYDYLYVYAQDAQGGRTEVAQYTGDIGGKVITVNAPAVVLRMVTDGSANRYGFEVVSVKAYYGDGYQVVPATGHNYEDVVTAPTCTEDGFTTHTCSNCSDSYVDDEVEALGHDLDPDAWTLTTVPTCSSEGEETNPCLRCGEIQTRSVQALAHTFDGDWVETTPVTCTQDGLKVKICSVCGAQGTWTMTGGLPGVNQYEYMNDMDMVFPTVTVPGASKIILHFDSNSALESSYDYLYVYEGDTADWDNQVAEFTGHFGSQTVTIYGDSFTLRMTTDGSVNDYYGFQVISLTCFNAEAYQVLPATGHNYETVVTAPTCTEDGYTTYTCANCADTYTTDYVDALGHDMDPEGWSMDQAPTCVVDGYKTNPCLRCGEVQTETIPATGHTFAEEWTTLEEVTCEKDGLKGKQCTVCEQWGVTILTEGLPSCTGSNYTNNMSKVFPTVTVPGATRLVLRFSSSSYLENRWDKLHVYAGTTASGSPVQTLTGSFGGTTVTVNAESVTLKMTTDHSITGTGFQLVEVIGYIDDAYVIIPAPGHNYQAVVTAPICTEDGYTTHTCSRCQDTYTTDYVGALGHDLDPEGWTQVQAPTCIVDGSKTNTCLRCGETVTEAIPATGHTFPEEWTTLKDVTCTDDGLNGKQCTVCQGWSTTILTEDLPSCIGTDYTHSISRIFPTVTVPGAVKLELRFSDSSALESGFDYLYVYAGTTATGTAVKTLTGFFGGTTVTVNGDSVTLRMTTDRSVLGNGFQLVEIIAYGADGYEVIPALGHDISEEWTVDAEPDCVNDGSKSHHCSRCDHKADVTAIPALGHSYGEWIPESDPTCTVDGSKYQQCSVCGGKSYESIPALGHTETSQVIAPDCDDYGYTLYTCSVCGGTRRDHYVDPLGHTETSEVIAPDCDDYGYTLYTCSVCGATRRDNYVDPLGHTETSEVIAPDCDDRGYTLYTCSVCGATRKDNYVAALGHTETSRVIAPDCDDWGYTLYTCSVCGGTRRDNYVDPLGHSYGQWIVDKEATVLATGSQHRVCSVCGYNQTQVIPAIEINIDENSNYGLAVFTVVNAQTLSPIRNAQIFISTTEDGENTFATDANGQVSVILPVGKQTVAVFASGCLTRNLNIVIRPGVNEVQQIGLSDKPTYDAEITATEMTYEEIVDAGIDVTAPGNQHVVKYEVQLNFKAEIDMNSIIAYFNADGNYIGGWAGDSDDDDDDDGDDDDDDKKPDNPSPGPIRVPVEDEVVSVYPVTEYFYLIVRGEVTWLKEMFDVEMLVINNSNTDTLEDLTATLELPEGLSLANMVGQNQTLAQHIDHVAEGETESVHWYVRGDNAGSYSLEARLQGTIMPFEEPIDDVFYAEDQIHVWAGGAMNLHFEFPNAAYHAEDYPIRITLTNVSDKPLYNVHHLVQATQGMEIYYSNETSKIRIEGSDWASSGVPVFNPGDQIILESTVNIFFESEIMEMKLQEMIDTVDNMEKLINGLKVVKAAAELLTGWYKCADECAEALGKYVPKMVNESIEKAKLVKELVDAIADLNDTQATTGDEVLDEILKVGDSGLSTTLQLITSDPEAWVDGSNMEEIGNLIKEVKGLKKTIDTSTSSGRKFDLYDSLRTAISAIPIRYALASVVLTEDPNNTTSIPWTYSAYPAAPQYFGVSSVSKYFHALSTAAAAEVYDEFMPGFFMLIPGLDDPFNSEEAIRYIQATEDEIAKVKAKDATGEVSFTARVETRSRSAEPSFLLSSDNESAYVDESGVLHFTGDGMIEILPQDLSSGVLYIEDSLGNQYIYNINVAPAHEHTEGDVEVIIPYMGETNGFGAVLCEVCGDMIDVVELTSETCGGNHSFGDWKTLTEADCEANGTQIRTCSVCGINEHNYTEAWGHTYSTVSQDPTCDVDGFITNSCSTCGTVKTEVVPAPGHDWIAATCTTAKVCDVCGTTEGEALGHCHTLESTYNFTGDGRHDVFCGDCGAFVENVSCEYDPLTLLCVCGAGGTGWHTDSRGTTYLSNGVVIYKQTMAAIAGDTYYFDADGYIVKDIVSWNGSLVAMDRTTGKRMDGYQGIYTAADGELYYIEDAVAVANKGLVKVTLEDGHVHYYYFGCCEAGCGSYKAQKNTTHRAYITNGLLMDITFTFDASGVILHNVNTSLQGINPDENGVDCYYEDGIKLPKGLFIGEDGQYYYADQNCEIVKDCTCFVGTTNGLTYGGKPVVMGTYVFDAQGALMFDADRNGFFFENGGWRYYVNDKLNYAGLIWCNGPEGNDPGYYYVNSKCMLVTNSTYWITKNNGLLVSRNYHFDENGTMDVKNGFYFENGAWYYYQNDKLNYAGLIWCNGPEGNDPGYYYINSKGMLVTDCTYWITKTNGHMDSKNGIFDENGTLAGKNGFYNEGGVWYYYGDDKRNYAGLIWSDGPMGNAPGYYYVNSKGMLVTDRTYWITKTNGHMESQNCTFDENGKMIQN